MSTTNHFNFMNLALKLAERGRYTVSPNPMVGCVIVKDNHIIGEGFHQRAGEDHAEIIALRQAGTAARNATMYVTLEPCCHHGKTPPCTDAIIHAGIKKIYAACIDPNHLMSGNGISALQSAGIEVETGLCQPEAEKLNEIFFHFIRHKRPFIIAKWAMSLDGKTSTHSHDTPEISCEQSRHFSHQIRQRVDAVLIGAHTAKIDNPRLTVRHGSVTRQPRRIILSSQGRLPAELNLFDPASPATTIVATTAAIAGYTRQSLIEKNVDVMVLPKNSHGKVDLPALLTELGKREITSILVEGGMTVLESFFQENLVNQVNVYLAPVIIGSMLKKHSLTNINLSRIERDFYFTGTYMETANV